MDQQTKQIVLTIAYVVIGLVAFIALSAIASEVAVRFLGLYGLLVGPLVVLVAAAAALQIYKKQRKP